MSMKLEPDDDLWSNSAAGGGSSLDWPPLLNDPCLGAPGLDGHPSAMHHHHAPPPPGSHHHHTHAHHHHHAHSMGMAEPPLMSPPATTPTPSIHTTSASSVSDRASSTGASATNKSDASASNGTVTAAPGGKVTHPEWGVMKDHEFHPLAHKHQRDLENLYQTNAVLNDFYFWQANLGGYCMADMVQNVVVSSDQVFVLMRKIVDGAPHPGRRKKKKT
ncbi:hypothetical protein BC940DRAFT_312456 [Gongronella butleri]|nr:hypothetical protein BC940DRAFT_312456 [Gongronella butleri]